METSQEASTPKKHVRHGSSGRALPRRSTRGPLDMSDSPLPIHTNPLTSPTSLANQQSSSLLSPSTSQYATPRLPSPQPGSNLSNLSYKTARTSSRSPIRVSSPSPTTPATQKNFSFLLRPEIYHPLTMLDVPPPFRVASAQPDPSTPLPDLVTNGHYRSAAIKAAQLLTAPGLNPSNHKEIFDLVYTRLSCLTLCNQTTLAAQEVKALEDLNSSYYRDDASGTHLVPWELRVLAVRLQGMGFNDARRGVMGYYDLVREARSHLKSLKKQKVVEETEEVVEEIDLWEERLSELGVRVASALIEMEDLSGARHFLSSLSSGSSSGTDQQLQIQKALLYLCIGDIETARSCITALDEGHESKVILALAHMADSEFEKAVPIWEGLIVLAAKEGDKKEKSMYKQNLSVSLLYLGHMDQARNHLESLVEEGNSNHALTFNLSTIYELCTERSRSLKINLAEQVAVMQEGMGVKVGWEKVNGDFKL